MKTLRRKLFTLGLIALLLVPDAGAGSWCRWACAAKRELADGVADVLDDLSPCFGNQVCIDNDATKLAQTHHENADAEWVCSQGCPDPLPQPRYSMQMYDLFTEVYTSSFYDPFFSGSGLGGGYTPPPPGLQN